MKRYLPLILLLAFACSPAPKNTELQLAVDGDGNLVTLGLDGHNYAGGMPLWRMYYNTPERKEIELTAADGTPAVTTFMDTIYVDYASLGGKAFELHLKMWIQDEQAHFSARVVNNEPHTIIRELQYPLVGNLQLPKGYKLLTTHTGGQIFDNPVQKISNVDTRALYMTPAQKFRQLDLQYPRNAASNCFAFIGTHDGLYFGSHDASLQQTWHGLRTYPEPVIPRPSSSPVIPRPSSSPVIPRPSSSPVIPRPSGPSVSPGTEAIGHTPGDFTRLEAGFYRYPNAMCGDSWENDATVIAPYRGPWTETSRIYRAWADSWWHAPEPPQWVREMTGWQRIIFKHQYGEYLHPWSELPAHIADVGESVGCNTVLAFGWWKEGMDNGYPNYSTDDTQGGDEAWKQAISAYRARGGHLVLYYNGRLIDVESDFYSKGAGPTVTNRDNTGREFTEHYKFTGEGTTLGYYDSRTFTIADMSNPLWRSMLIDMAQRAIDYGADAVFYDQLGVAEEFPDWDLSREFPVQDIFTGRYKADALHEIRDYVKAADPDFGLGTEWLSDCTSQWCDFVHIVEFTALPESFPEWFRYTFPEVIWSDRCVRDDNDVPRRVNNTLVKGLRNDIEVFRCRGLIDQTPVYQDWLARVNAIRHEFPELLLEGRFAWHDDFSCSNPRIVACEYVSGKRMAVVATSLGAGRASGLISAPGYKLVAKRKIGSARVNGCHVSLNANDLAVLVFEKK